MEEVGYKPGVKEQNLMDCERGDYENCELASSVSDKCERKLIRTTLTEQ